MIIGPFKIFFMAKIKISWPFWNIGINGNLENTVTYLIESNIIRLHLLLFFHHLMPLEEEEKDWGMWLRKVFSLPGWTILRFLAVRISFSVLATSSLTPFLTSLLRSSVSKDYYSRIVSIYRIRIRQYLRVFANSPKNDYYVFTNSRKMRLLTTIHDYWNFN